MARRMDGLVFWMLTPCWMTCGGSWADASWYLFWTWTVASSGLVPTSYVSW